MRARVDRERISRTLTFWLRPAFVLRVLNRFQRVAGFDRAIALGLIGAAVYVPHLLSSYASRFGVIGAVLAMISALFALMIIVVVSTVTGREVSDELDRIGRGERPQDDEVRREWDAVIDQARSRWDTLRERIDHVRRRDRHGR
jgi:type IV secretory pathway TraG/TraD family ATPase VirD4